MSASDTSAKSLGRSWVTWGKTVSSTGRGRARGQGLPTRDPRSSGLARHGLQYSKKPLPTSGPAFPDGRPIFPVISGWTDAAQAPPSRVEASRRSRRLDVQADENQGGGGPTPSGVRRRLQCREVTRRRHIPLASSAGRLEEIGKEGETERTRLVGDLDRRLPKRRAPGAGAVGDLRRRALPQAGARSAPTRAPRAEPVEDGRNRSRCRLRRRATAIESDEVVVDPGGLVAPSDEASREHPDLRVRRSIRDRLDHQVGSRRGRGGRW